MKRKRMTKRIAAIILAAVMMIPTHVTSFAKQMLLCRTPQGRRQAMPHPVIPRQHSQRESGRQRRMTAKTTGTDTNAATTTQNSSASDTKNSTTNNSASDAQSRQQIILLQMHRTAQQIILLQMHRAVQQQIPTAQILPPVAQPIISQAG